MGMGDPRVDQIAGKNTEYRREICPKIRGQGGTDGEWEIVSWTQHQRIDGYKSSEGIFT